MHNTEDFATPKKYSCYTGANYSNFDEYNSPTSILEPIGKPHNHVNITRSGERKKTTPKQLNLNSSKFMKGGLSPFAYAESTNATFDSTDVTHSSVATEPVGLGSDLMIDQLDTENFKSKSCPFPTIHNHKICPFFHNSKDYKRPGNTYSAELCEYASDPDTCPAGDKCPKAHNRVEQLYKPEKYKTKFCSHYPNNLSLCEYGIFCSFAHSEEDINIDLIHNYEYDNDFYMFHFKTAWCPFNLTYHDKAKCVYAHNWQDYRRKPQAARYEPVACPNWKSTDFVVNYEDGCQNKEKCNKCHGWKELEYHPLLYKTKPCSVRSCLKGRDCPNHHTNADRRIIEPHVHSKIFKPVPRNRVIDGTFKTRKAGNSALHKNHSHPISKNSPSAEPAFSLDNGVIFSPTLIIDPIQDVFQSDNRSYWNNMFEELINHERKESVDMYAVDDWDTKRRYSADFSGVNNVNVATTYVQGRFNQTLNHSGTGNRKWSANDLESFGSVYRDQSSQPLEGLTSKVLSQNRTREFEENCDSIEGHRNFQDLENDDTLDKNFEADLRRSLERFIDGDEI